MNLIREYFKDPYYISTDKSKIDVAEVHQYLSERSYWAKGIPREKVQRAIDNSLTFSIYKDDSQIGYARVISDFTIFAYLADVFVLEEYRGKGLSKWLMEVITNFPELQGLRRWMLLTKDAHSLYSKYGFKPMSNPEMAMEISNPNLFLTNKEK